MKAERKQRQLIAWILVLCMLPLAATKLTHRHTEERPSCCASHAEEHEDQDDADYCFVCKFTLSPFLSFESTENTLFLALVPVEPTYYVSGHTIEAPHTYLLRGPPAA